MKPKWFMVVFTITIFIWSCAYGIPVVGQPVNELGLTPEELHFLKINPVLRVSNETDWPPYDYAVNGEPQGLSIDYLKLIEKRLNVKFEFVNGYTWDQLLQMGYDKKIDIMHTMVKIPERADHLLFTEPYTIMKPAFAFKTEVTIVETFNDLRGKTLAYPKGYADDTWIKRTYPQINVLTVDNAIEGIGAVKEGKADAFYDNVTVILKIIKDKEIKGITTHISGDVRDTNSTHLRLGVRNDWPLLKSILEKAMNSITYEEKEELSRRWTGGLNLFYSATDLTEEEGIWLREHPTIDIAVDKNMDPLSYVDSEGKYSGIMSEYLEELSYLLGVEFNVVPVANEKEAINKIISKEVEAAVPISITLEGEQQLLFTPSVYLLPIVIYGNDNLPVVEDLYNLPGTRIAIEKDSSLYYWVKRDYPGVSIYPVEDIGKALTKIEAGENWILIDDFLTINRKILEERYKNIRITGQLNYQYNMAFAVDKDQEVLRIILQKTLKKIQDEKKDLIAQKWLTKMVEMPQDNTLVYKIVVGILLVLVVILYRTIVTQRLMRKISKHMEIIDQNIMSIKLNKVFEIQEISTALCNCLGIAQQPLKGKNIEKLFTLSKTLSAETFLENGTCEASYHLAEENRDIGFNCDITLERNASGVVGYIAILKERTAAEAQEESTLKDGLTGAYNRRAYDLFVNREMLLARRNGLLLAYMIIDLDNFKNYNDLYGHLAGDDALKQTVTVIEEHLKRSNDYLFRLGGERFILLSSHQNVNQAMRFAQGVREAVANLKIPHKDNAPWSGLTVSIGISFFKDQDPLEEEALYARADEALYRAKESGKNKIEIV